MILNNVSFSFGEKQILKNLTHTFPTRGVVAIMGPSGCGKTTLLRLLAGLLTPDGGEILNRPKRVAISFAEPRLLPQKTVLQNVLFPLNSKEKQSEEIQKMLEIAGLAKEKNTKPAALSCGMQSRVSLLRALCAPADLVLLDEPFSALDEARKAALAPLILKKAEGTLVLVVTHSKDEAALLGAPVLAFHQTPLTAFE